MVRLPLVLSPFLVGGRSAPSASSTSSRFGSRSARRCAGTSTRRARAPAPPARVARRPRARSRESTRAERDRLIVTQPLQPGTFSHGAFLRWPSAKTARWLLTNRKNAPSLFSTRIGTRLSSELLQTVGEVKSGQMCNLSVTPQLQAALELARTNGYQLVPWVQDAGAWALEAPEEFVN